MKKERREEIVGEWRSELSPLLADKLVTQEDVANRLAGYYGGSIDQTNVSRWLGQTTPQPGVMSAILRMLNEIRAGEWPSKAGAQEGKAVEVAPSWLPEWLREAWLSDARASERRAAALENFSVAARLEAETARDRQRMLSPDERALRIAGQGKEAIELERRKQLQRESQSGDTPPPQTPDRSTPETGQDSAAHGRN